VPLTSHTLPVACSHCISLEREREREGGREGKERKRTKYGLLFFTHVSAQSRAILPLFVCSSEDGDAGRCERARVCISEQVCV